MATVKWHFQCSLLPGWRTSVRPLGSAAQAHICGPTSFLFHFDFSIPTHLLAKSSHQTLYEGSKSQFCDIRHFSCRRGEALSTIQSQIKYQNSAFFTQEPAPKSGDPCCFLFNISCTDDICCPGSCFKGQPSVFICFVRGLWPLRSLENSVPNNDLWVSTSYYVRLSFPTHCDEIHPISLYSL